MIRTRLTTARTRRIDFTRQLLARARMIPRITIAHRRAIARDHTNPVTTTIHRLAHVDVRIANQRIIGIVVIPVATNANRRIILIDEANAATFATAIHAITRIDIHHTGERRILRRVITRITQTHRALARGYALAMFRTRHTLARIDIRHALRRPLRVITLVAHAIRLIRARQKTRPVIRTTHALARIVRHLDFARKLIVAHVIAAITHAHRRVVRRQQTRPMTRTILIRTRRHIAFTKERIRRRRVISRLTHANRRIIRRDDACPVAATIDVFTRIDDDFIRNARRQRRFIGVITAIAQTRRRIRRRHQTLTMSRTRNLRTRIRIRHATQARRPLEMIPRIAQTNARIIGRHNAHPMTRTRLTLTRTGVFFTRHLVAIGVVIPRIAQANRRRFRGRRTRPMRPTIHRVANLKDFTHRKIFRRTRTRRQRHDRQ